MSKPRIGWIGTGIMGLPMARNLLKAGFPLTAWNRTGSKLSALTSDGANAANDPAEAARQSDVIISIVSDSPDVEAVYLGENGICAGLQPGAICIDMSTVSPDTSRKVARVVADRGGSFLDAPVSGGKNGAEAGTLSIMVGGEAETLERARPILSAMGQTIVHCGPVGNGQLTKLCNQVLCGLNLLAVSEALVFAERVGLDRRVVLQAVSKGAAQSWALENLGPRMIDRDFAPMFMVDLQQKDLRIALSAAATARVPLPGTSLVHALLGANQAACEGREGTQALVKVIDRLAGSGANRDPGGA